MRRILGHASLAIGAALLLADGHTAAATTPQPADIVYLGADIATMDQDQPTAKAVAVKGDDILAVGTEAEIRRLIGPDTQTVRLDGATVLPGFIDPHSHFLGYAFFTDAKNWLDVSSVNLFFKPLPGDPRCKDPTDPQVCFIPVRSQDDVIERITKAAKKGKPVYAMSYDPSRLGHGKSCPGPASRVGFECPNFENGNSRATLDAISKEVEIYVSSQSGHIAYANTKALRKLNICGTGVEDKKTCREPIINPAQEKSLAKSGQLDEDLALFGDSYFIGQVLKSDPLSAIRSIAGGIDVYAGHGYTLIQEGAATPGDATIYRDLMKDPRFPFTVALMMYDNDSAKFAGTVQAARQAEQTIKGHEGIFIAGLKSFADGTPQGYTADLSAPYNKVFPPFTRPPFPQPYTGLPDLTTTALKQHAERAHANGYPIMLHQNGDQAIKNSIRALELAQPESPKPFRDIVLHAPFLSSTLLARLKALNDPVSFLMPNIYFWGLPLCQQVLGPEVFTRRYTPYPARSAKNMGLKVTLHTDSPVNPPDPLFTIWVAKTRTVQQPAWYPNTNRGACPTVAGPQEVISIEQGIRGFTANAAWQYGLLNKRGTITAGKAADMVVLSKNPLSMESNPDELRHVRVLGTVHSGHYRKNPLRFGAPIWPADVE
ncbi:MAG: amidohydrolase [Geminicoccaceae bacterium]